MPRRSLDLDSLPDDATVKYGGQWMTVVQARKKKQRAKDRWKAEQEGRTQVREAALSAGEPVPADAAQPGDKVLGAPVAKQLRTEEAEALRQAGYQAVIEWVWEHLNEKVCPRGASPKAEALWRQAVENRGEFLRTYVPLLVRRRADEEEDIEAARQDQEVEKLARDWLNRHKIVPCPACGGDGIMNPRYLYSVVLTQDLTDGGGI